MELRRMGMQKRDKREEVASTVREFYVLRWVHMTPKKF